MILKKSIENVPLPQYLFQQGAIVAGAGAVGLGSAVGIGALVGAIVGAVGGPIGMALGAEVGVIAGLVADPVLVWGFMRYKNQQKQQPST